MLVVVGNVWTELLTAYVPHRSCSMVKHCAGLILGGEIFIRPESRWPCKCSLADPDPAGEEFRLGQM